MRNEANDGLLTCPHCRQLTPEENLHCIYCGELLKQPVGFMSGLVLGGRGWLGLALIVLLLLAFLIWLL